MKTLTSVKDTDVMILHALKYSDLKSICQTNVYFSNLCQEDQYINDKIEDINNEVNDIILLLDKIDTYGFPQPIKFNVDTKFNEFDKFRKTDIGGYTYDKNVKVNIIEIVKGYDGTYNISYKFNKVYKFYQLIFNHEHNYGTKHYTQTVNIIELKKILTNVLYDNLI